MVVRLFTLLLAGSVLAGGAYRLSHRAQPAIVHANLMLQPSPGGPGSTSDFEIRTPNSKDGNPVELGAVNWLRDFDAGRAEAQKSGKPLLILFQEVPGCSNCTRYGSVTLSHPLIVEAIESCFVPVCIYNNKGGKDGETLQAFRESAWNNPVVRIVRAGDRSDLVPRMSDFRSSAALASGMIKALEKTGAAAPVYLQLVEEELLARETAIETATFSMYCFWAGEGAFGSIPGVVETAPGYQDGREVVRVTYNPAVVQKNELESLTQPKGISACAHNDGFRTDREPKYYLAQTPWKYVPMTSLQACRANSLVGQGKAPEPVLSPRQIDLGRYAQAHPEKKWQNAIGAADLTKAWEAAQRNR